MRQALHIFRKDVRLLRLPILVTLAMTALFAGSHSVDPARFARGNADADSVLSTISFFMVMGWWYFIACLIYKEQPAGDRQFWVTRPYSWKSLLAAKALEVFAFINVPFLISDVAIVSANGLSPARAAASLLGRQIALTAILLLPAAALGAVTRHLAEMVLTAFVGFAGLGVLSSITESESFYQSWDRLEWIPEWTTAAALAVGMLGVLVWQYSRRRTWISRGSLAGVVGLCAAILLVKPFGAAIALQTHFPASENMPAVHLSFAPGSRPEGDLSISAHETVRFAAVGGSLPIRIDGLPPGTHARVDLVQARIQSPQSGWWSSGWVAFNRNRENPGPMEWFQGWNSGENAVVYLTFGKPAQAWLASQGVTLDVSLAMTVFRTGTTVPLTADEPPAEIAGLGMCSIHSEDGPRSPALVCRSVTARSVRLLVNGVALLQASYAPDLGVLEESPISTESVRDRSVFFHPPFVLTTERPVAHLRRDLEIPRIRLVEGSFKP